MNDIKGKPISDREQDRGLPQQETSKDAKDWLSRIPTALKAIIIKAWFAGAVYYFFNWSLDFQATDSLDLIVVTGAIIGVIMDLIVNKVLLSISTKGDGVQRYLMFYSKKFYSLILNTIYGVLLALLVALVYFAVNITVIALLGLPSDAVPLGVEPILFGIFYMLLDMAFVGCRNIVRRLWRMRKASGA